VAYGLGLLAAVQGLKEVAPAGIALLAPVLLMLMSATRMAWDLLEYVGKASKGDTDAAAG
jgi:hypothetical protein